MWVCVCIGVCDWQADARLVYGWRIHSYVYVCVCVCACMRVCVVDQTAQASWIIMNNKGRLSVALPSRAATAETRLIDNGLLEALYGNVKRERQKNGERGR